MKYDIPVVFGGPHPTISPEETIRNPYVDIICIGEGEEALTELLNKLENKEDIYETKNFWFKKDGKVIRNSVRNLIENLDLLPFPDREIFDFKKYLEVTNEVEIISGRGCPYNCTYCINHILQNIYKNKGKYVRKRSVENVLKEIRYLVDNYDIKYITFHDDIFTSDKEWLIKLCKEYRKRFNIPFICNARVETVDKEMLIELKKAGCETINIGIETGSERIRTEILNRNMSNHQIIKIFRLAKEAGLATYSCNMVGLPYQTKRDYWETIKLNQKIKPSFMQVSSFQPYPGTDLYKLCKEKNWISNKPLPNTHRVNSIMNYPDKSSFTINLRRKLFRFRVLRKYSLLKAFIVLILDLNYGLFFKIRKKIPLSIKKILFKINRLFRN